MYLHPYFLGSQIIVKYIRFGIAHIINLQLCSWSQLLSYGFLHNIYVGFIPWQKWCNFINLFPYTLWDLIVIDLVLSGWWLLKTVDLATCSRVDNPWNVTWEANAGCWKVFCQAVFRKSFHDLAKSRMACETLCLDDFKCDSYTLHS